MKMSTPTYVCALQSSDQELGPQIEEASSHDEAALIFAAKIPRPSHFSPSGTRYHLVVTDIFRAEAKRVTVEIKPRIVSRDSGALPQSEAQARKEGER